MPTEPIGFSQVIDVLSQGLVVLDRDLRVVAWNRWMEEHSVLRREAVLGRPITEVFPELERRGFRWKVRNVFKLGNFAFFSEQLYGHLFPLPCPAHARDRFGQMQQQVVIAPITQATSDVAVSFGLDGHPPGPARSAAQYVCISILDYTDVVAFRQQLEELSRTDYLTRLANRQHLFERLREEANRHFRRQRSMSVGLIDIDHFKAVNDRHGHARGDQVLVAIATAIKGCLRAYDLVGRYGGEEFCVVLPETTLEQGLDTMERVRRAVAAVSVLCNEVVLRCTVSAGITCYFPGTDPPDIDALLLQADAALYQAKHNGRDRVEAAVEAAAAAAARG